MAKKGNQNAKGNKGGGRKSMYEEIARARGLTDAWFDEGIDMEEAVKIMEKLKKKKGKIKIFDIYKMKAVIGKNADRVMIDQAKKLFPDKIDVQQKTETVLDEKTQELLEMLKKKEEKIITKKRNKKEKK